MIGLNNKQETGNENKGFEWEPCEHCNLTERDFYPIEYNSLTERDFYPIEDNRVFLSGVDDIDGGDNFADYAKWFYDQYEEDIFEIETVC